MAEVNSRHARPSSLDSVIGQQQVIDSVRVALAAAGNDGTKFDHTLLLGPPGLGKTQISNLIGMEMGCGYREVLAQSLSSANDVNALILASKDRGVLLLDEIHGACQDIQVYLYQYIDSRRLTLQSNRKAGGPPLEVRASDVTLLLATTDEYRILAPLRQRCRLTLRFNFYSCDELARICEERVAALGWAVDDDRVFEDIAKRSRGTPRIALRFLQSAYRISRSKDSGVITREDLETACRLEDIDTFGLGHLERSYLNTISQGPTRLNVIASQLGLPSRTISTVIEPYLLRLGWISSGQNSIRMMTELGNNLYRTVLDA